MKRILFCIAGLGFALCSKSQTLQSITTNGNTTNLPIALIGDDVMGVVNRLQYKINTNTVAEIGAEKVVAAGQLTDLYFTTRSAAGISEQLRIKYNGNVGVGTTNPLAKLDIRGYVVLESGRDAILFTGTANTEQNRYLKLLNSPALTSASGLKAGGVLIADSYAYANPSKNDLIVKGNVGIGTPTPGEKLSVNGHIRAQAVKVEMNNWPDYVFEDHYSLRPLRELKNYLETHEHLPGVPSASEIEKEGVNLGEMNAKLLEKIEELTLYLISQEEALAKLRKEVQSLRKRMETEH